MASCQKRDGSSHASGSAGKTRRFGIAVGKAAAGKTLDGGRRLLFAARETADGAEQGLREWPRRITGPLEVTDKRFITEALDPFLVQTRAFLRRERLLDFVLHFGKGSCSRRSAFFDVHEIKLLGRHWQCKAIIIAVVGVTGNVAIATSRG